MKILQQGYLDLIDDLVIDALRSYRNKCTIQLLRYTLVTFSKVK